MCDCGKLIEGLQAKLQATTIRLEEAEKDVERLEETEREVIRLNDLVKCVNDGGESAECYACEKYYNAEDPTLTTCENCDVTFCYECAFQKNYMTERRDSSVICTACVREVPFSPEFSTSDEEDDDDNDESGQDTKRTKTV